MAAQSRSLMVDLDRGKSANWVLPDLAPMNDRNREILCDATKSVTRPREVSASAKAACAKGGFVRIAVVGA